MNAPVVLDSELEIAILARLQDVLGQIGWLAKPLAGGVRPRARSVVT